MYNVLEKLRSGEPLNPAEQRIHLEGAVTVLRELHDALDEAVAQAYGWAVSQGSSDLGQASRCPADLDDEGILERIVALNAARAAEERDGKIRWLRPAYQNPKGAQEATQTSVSYTHLTLPTNREV